MLSQDMIEETILELEAKDTTFSTCERLAPLYIVLDHLQKYKEESVPKGISANGSSEFLQAVNGKNPDQVWPIIDSHMEELKFMFPKTYDSILAKIKNL